MPKRRDATAPAGHTAAAWLRMTGPPTLLLVLQAGCQEVVHMGQLSDRLAAYSINSARIEQQQEDGSWKLLGKTDGNGRWWIMKRDIRDGGRIRISKPGYYPLEMREAEFLQEYNLLMVPMQGGGFAEDPRDLRRRGRSDGREPRPRGTGGG